MLGLRSSMATLRHCSCCSAESSSHWGWVSQSMYSDHRRPALTILPFLSTSVFLTSSTSLTFSAALLTSSASIASLAFLASLVLLTSMAHSVSLTPFFSASIRTAGFLSSASISVLWALLFLVSLCPAGISVPTPGPTRGVCCAGIGAGLGF